MAIFCCSKAIFLLLSEGDFSVAVLSRFDSDCNCFKTIYSIVVPRRFFFVVGLSFVVAPAVCGGFGVLNWFL